MSNKISREKYAMMYGPTVGDKVRLADTSLVIEVEKDCEISNGKCKLVLKIKNEDVRFDITLPMLDYFEELKNGIIATNIDPQLSHGIDSLKAKLAEYARREAADDELELIILGKKDYDLLKISVDNGVLRLL